MVKDQLSKATKTLILEEPFYGLFIVGLNKTYRKDIPTAGVMQNGIGVQLTINPEYFASFEYSEIILDIQAGSPHKST